MTAITKRAKFTYDNSFQEKILRALYQDPEFAYTVAGNLSTTHFTKRSYSWLAHKILAYVGKYGHGVSTDALKNYLLLDVKYQRLAEAHQREVEFLIGKLEAPVPDRTYIKDALADFIGHQSLKEAILDSLEYLKHGEQDKVRESFYQAIEIEYTLKDGDIGTSYMSNRKKRIDARKAYVKDGIPCGLTLDKYLKPGGLSAGKLGVAVAPTGRGKSHVLVHIGKTALLAKKKVLHITLGDLDVIDIEDRYDASLTGYQIDELEQRGDDIEKALEEMEISGIEDNLLVKYFPSITLTPRMLKAYLRRLERKAFYPDVILIDYADEMIPDNKKDSEYESQGNVYRALRNIAKEHKCAIWTASQTTRSALKQQDLDLDVLADSFKKAMIADVMIFVCQTAREKARKKARFFVGKNRLGIDKFFFEASFDTSRSYIQCTDDKITYLSVVEAEKLDQLEEELETNEKMAA